MDSKTFKMGAQYEAKVVARVTELRAEISKPQSWAEYAASSFELRKLWQELADAGRDAAVRELLRNA